jgi:hypothetical protein
MPLRPMAGLQTEERSPLRDVDPHTHRVEPDIRFDIDTSLQVPAGSYVGRREDREAVLRVLHAERTRLLALGRSSQLAEEAPAYQQGRSHHLAQGDAEYLRDIEAEIDRLEEREYEETEGQRSWSRLEKLAVRLLELDEQKP